MDTSDFNNEDASVLGSNINQLSAFKVFLWKQRDNCFNYKTLDMKIRFKNSVAITSRGTLHINRKPKCYDVMNHCRPVITFINTLKK